METVKSSSHQKIIGKFGENLICNWLSRSGFEVTIIVASLDEAEKFW